MQMKPAERKIKDLIAADVAAMGYELVRVQITGGGRYTTLQIMADRLDGKPVTVDDCAAISHATSEKLEADETLADRYNLEVSSPGIDRPLTRLKDFYAYCGHLAKIELDAPVDGVADGKKKFQGELVRVDGDNAENATLIVRLDKQECSVPMQKIARAKLVLTDALLNAAASVQQQA